MDCENNVCSDSTQFIPVDKIFTRYGPTYKWVDNIGVIKLARSVQFTSTLIVFNWKFFCFHNINCCVVKINYQDM